MENPPLPPFLQYVEKSVETLWKSPKNPFAQGRFLKVIFFFFFLFFLFLGLGALTGAYTEAVTASIIGIGRKATDAYASHSVFGIIASS